MVCPITFALHLSPAHPDTRARCIALISTRLVIVPSVLLWVADAARSPIFFPSSHPDKPARQFPCKFRLHSFHGAATNQKIFLKTRPICRISPYNMQILYKSPSAPPDTSTPPLNFQNFSNLPNHNPSHPSLSIRPLGTLPSHSRSSPCHTPDLTNFSNHTNHQTLHHHFM